MNLLSTGNCCIPEVVFSETSSAGNVQCLQPGESLNVTHPVSLQSTSPLYSLGEAVGSHAVIISAFRYIHAFYKLLQFLAVT